MTHWSLMVWLCETERPIILDFIHIKSSTHITNPPSVFEFNSACKGYLSFLPRSAVWPSCRSCRWFWPWNRCPLCWRRLKWRSRLRSGTGRRSFPRCCFRLSAAWTCSQSFGRLHLFAPGLPHDLWLTPSIKQREVDEDTVRLNHNLSLKCQRLFDSSFSSIWWLSVFDTILT